MFTKIKEKLKAYPMLTKQVPCIWNLFYGLFLLAVGIRQASYWHITLSAFFLSLGVGRAIVFMRKGKTETKMNVVTVVLLFLAVVISGTSYLSIHETINPVRNIVIVIAQAAIAFTTISLAVYNIVVSYRKKDKKLMMIENLSLASAMGSMLSLERVMLGTFGDPKDLFTIYMEAGSGMAVFLVLIVMVYHMRTQINKGIDESRK